MVVLLFALLFARRANAGVDPTQLLLDPELVAKVRVLAQQNQQALAVTTLREGTPGLSLASARVMVGRMAAPRGGTAGTADRGTANLRAGEPGSEEADTGTGLLPDTDQDS